MKKVIYCLESAVIVFILIIIIIVFASKVSFHYFELDNDFKYLVTTDEQWWSTLNDGGSYSSSYYEIDFSNNMLEKRQDRYYKSFGATKLKRFMKSYQKRLVYRRTITQEQKKALKQLFDSILKSTDRGEIYDEYKCYILSTKDFSHIKMTQEEKEKFTQIVPEK